MLLVYSSCESNILSEMCCNLFLMLYHDSSFAKDNFFFHIILGIAAANTTVNNDP